MARTLIAALAVATAVVVAGPAGAYRAEYDPAFPGGFYANALPAVHAYANGEHYRLPLWAGCWVAAPIGACFDPAGYDVAGVPTIPVTAGDELHFWAPIFGVHRLSIDLPDVDDPALIGGSWRVPGSFSLPGYAVLRVEASRGSVEYLMYLDAR